MQEFLYQQRHSVRLKEYDYSQNGAYFITICAYNQGCLFGKIVDEKVQLNKLGKIAQEEWMHSAEIRQEIYLDEFIVMPNHLHGIVLIQQGDPPVAPTQKNPMTKPRGPEKKSLGSFVAGYKSSVAIKINRFRNTPGDKIWQRNYYEHIIRNDNSLNMIRNYIISNPMQWELDRENPDRVANVVSKKDQEPWRV
jgi:putative transposase